MESLQDQQDLPGQMYQMANFGEPLYYTDDLSYWPSLRSLEPEFLSRVDRFYQRGILRFLLWTHDDRVYRRRYQFRADKWSDPIEVPELSGQSVVQVAECFELTNMTFVINCTALTADGRLFGWREVMLSPRGFPPTKPTEILSGIRMIVDDSISITALGYNGTVWDMSNVTVEPSPIKALCGKSIVSIHASKDCLTALTNEGRCWIHEYYFNSPRNNGWVTYPLPESENTVEIVANDLTIFTLDRNGQVFQYNYDRNLMSYRARVYLDEPIRRMFSCKIFEDVYFQGESGRLYHCEKLWSSQAHTSFVDLCSMMLYPLTPQITTIPAHAQRNGCFNNPRTADVKLVRDQLLDVENMPIYASREKLRHNSPYLRRLIDLCEPRIELEDKSALAIPGGADGITHYGALFNYLYYLHTGHLSNVEINSFHLYHLSFEYEDHRLQSIAIDTIVRLISRKFRYDRSVLLDYIESHLWHLKHLHLESMHPRDERVKPDSNLKARLVRYMVERAILEPLSSLYLEQLFRGSNST